VDDHVRRARAPIPPAAKRESAAPKAEYKRYVDALSRGEYATAVAGLENFVKRFPQDSLADNAQYWLGEAHYDQRQFASALAAFENVIVRFPLGNKVPDALLKIAFCQLQLGNAEAGQSTLRRLLSEYPESNPATLAARKLEELKG